MAQRIFNRGEIYWVNLDKEESQDKKPQPKGSEEQKNRPGVIISNQKQNQFSNCVIVALITSQVDKIYPFQVYSELAGKNGIILVDQIRTIDRKRFGKKLGELDFEAMEKIERALHITLSLKN